MLYKKGSNIQGDPMIATIIISKMTFLKIFHCEYLKR